MEKGEVVIPQMLGFEALNKVLIGFLRAGGDRNAVHYEDVAQRTGIAVANISRNNKFLVSAGFLRLEKRGHFQLTDSGARYAQTLDWEREEDAKECLKQVLKSSQFFMKIADYVRINKEVSRDDLMTAVATMAHVPKKAKYVTGINAIVDMLTFSGILSEEADMLKFVEKEAISIELVEKPSEELIEFVIKTEHYAVEKSALKDFITRHGKRVHGEQYHL